MVLLTLYHGTKNDTNTLWMRGFYQSKSVEMFNGRLKVNYSLQQRVSVTIKNVNYNDSVTILMSGVFLLNGITGTPFHSSVMIDVQGQ